MLIRNSMIAFVTSAAIAWSIPQVACAVPTAAIIIGEIQAIKVDNRANPWSRGVITVGGVDVIIPANLIIQMPVQRYTVQELFTNATPACRAVSQTGLARGDSCFLGNRGGIATINANRQDTGEVIAGMVKIDKNPEILMGVVTYINHMDGYFRVNGKPHDSNSGAMIRINDPTARHTIQSGLGCAAASSRNNCSPDIRFPVDNENYTVAFMTGVPLCIPSSQSGGSAKRVNLADTSGFGDDYCPMWGRQPDPIIDTIPDTFNGKPVADRLVPIVLGDSLDAMGSFEVVDGVKFFSAHTIKVHARIMTKPGNPDYMTYNLVEMDMAGYTNQRAGLRIIGFTSLEDSQLDIYALHIDPASGSATEFPLASTVGNPLTINKGLAPFGGSIFKIIDEVDFVAGVRANNSPCFNLARAGFLGGDAMTGGCPSGATTDIAQNFGVLAPVSRDIIGRTRNKFLRMMNGSDAPSKDILGNDTPNGQYVSPVEVTPPDPLETNVNAVQASFLFTGLPWAMDRRLGPLGIGKVAGDQAGTNVRLDPWPWDGGIDPRRDSLNPPTASVPVETADRILSFVKGEPGQFLPGNILILPKGPSVSTGVTATTVLTPKICLP